MGRHSKSTNMRGFFSNAEREMAGHGTQRLHLGEDSQNQFDQCRLCLGRLRHPIVASPSGYLFCKLCILENLVTQKEAIGKAREKWDIQQARLARETEAEATRAATQHIVDFERFERGSGVGSSSSRSSGGGGGGVSKLVADRAARFDAREKEEKQAEVSKSAFWAPAVTPTAAPTSAKAPERCPRDPVSGEFLRARDLLKVDLHRLTAESDDDDEEKEDAAKKDDALDTSKTGSQNEAAEDAVGAGGGSSSSSSSNSSSHKKSSKSSSASNNTNIGVSDGGMSSTGVGPSTIRSLRHDDVRFGCPACLKGIIYQRVFLMKPCGHVICDKCVTQFVAKNKRCVQCDIPITAKSDLLPLQAGGSAFSAHDGTVAEASKYSYSGLS